MKYLFLLLFALVSISAAAPVQGPGDEMSDMYSVALKITAGDRIVGAPSFIMRNGSTATTTRTGESGYALKAVVKRIGAAAERRVSLAIDLRLSDGTRWLPAGQPSVQVGLGTTSTVSLAPLSGKAVKLEIKIDDKFDGKIAAMPTFGRNACTGKRIALWHTTMSQPVSMLPAVNILRWVTAVRLALV